MNKKIKQHETTILANSITKPIRQPKYSLSTIWIILTLINTHNSHKKYSQNLTNINSQTQSPNAPNKSFTT